MIWWDRIHINTMYQIFDMYYYPDRIPVVDRIRASNIHFYYSIDSKIMKTRLNQWYFSYTWDDGPPEFCFFPISGGELNWDKHIITNWWRFLLASKMQLLVMQIIHEIWSCAPIMTSLSFQTNKTVQHQRGDISWTLYRQWKWGHDK